MWHCRFVHTLLRSWILGCGFGFFYNPMYMMWICSWYSIRQVEAWYNVFYARKVESSSGGESTSSVKMWIFPRSLAPWMESHGNWLENLIYASISMRTRFGGFWNSFGQIPTFRGIFYAKTGQKQPKMVIKCSYLVQTGDFLPHQLLLWEASRGGTFFLQIQ